MLFEDDVAPHVTAWHTTKRQKQGRNVALKPRRVTRVRCINNINSIPIVLDTQVCLYCHSTTAVGHALRGVKAITLLVNTLYIRQR